jgi:hypothetical protein
MRVTSGLEIVGKKTPTTVLVKALSEQAVMKVTQQRNDAGTSNLLEHPSARVRGLPHTNMYEYNDI